MKFLEWIKTNITPEMMHRLGISLVTIIVLYVVYRVVRKYARKAWANKPQFSNYLIVEKVLKYTFVVVVVLYILSLFGVNLSALIGAAGIAGVAIGFAAQTSFSNIISGFFVLGEQTIHVGDLITVGDITGTVSSIDLLSVRITTPDNQLVRIPNETIIKSNVINITYFPERRLCLKITVDFPSDMEKVEEVLLSLAESEDLVLIDPAPRVIFDAFGESGMELLFCVWMKREDFLTVKNAIYKGVLRVFDENDIIIPYNKIDVLMDAN